MKPVKLILKGLNSFFEKQTIDFEKLTERGLFGIFGPTGSGKSTILDGITLALYGKTSRNSTNFINTHCDEMSITYEFLIRDSEEKHYVIDRTFKRNKEGGINAKKPTRIVEITDGEPVVLEETPTAVDKKCIDILGLRFEDFIRTVVLPQGKFSEFLKLEGKPRREMLERLFNLDKYGNELSIKLGAVSKKARSNMDKIEGQLKGYEAVNEDIYKLKKAELDGHKVEEAKAEEQLKKTAENYSELEKIWMLKNECEAYMKTAFEMEAQKEEIDDKKERVQKGENSLKVKPYIDNVNSTSKYINEVEKNISVNEVLVEKLMTSKKQLSINFEAAREKKDCEIPRLKVKENNAELAIEEEAAKKKLEQEVDSLREQYKEKLILKNTEDKKSEEIKQKIIELSRKYDEGEKRLEALTIDETHRSGVQKGLILEEKLKIACSRKDKFENNLKDIVYKIEKASDSIIKLEAEISKKDKALSEYNNKLEHLKEVSPGDTNLLLTMQQEINELTAAKDAGTAFETEIEQLNSEVSGLQIGIAENKKLKIVFSEKAESLRKKLEKNKEENLAEILRNKLAEGMPCPVCGSTEHRFERHSKADNLELEKLEEELELNEDKLRTAENEILKNEVKLKSCCEKTELAGKELEKLGEKWKTVNIEALKETFKLKKAAIEKWTDDKEETEKQIKAFTEQLNVSKVDLGRNKSILLESELSRDKNKAEYDEVLKELDQQEIMLNSLKEELVVNNFSERSAEIKKLDKEKEALEKIIKSLRTEMNQLEENKEAGKKCLEELAGILAALKTKGEEKKNQAEEKEKNIKNRVGEIPDLQVYKIQLVNEMESIQSTFNRLEKEKNKIEEQYNKCVGELNAQKIELKKAEARIKEEDQKLQAALAAAGYVNAEEAEVFLITDEEIKALKTEIQDYENNVLELNAKIQEVSRKLAGKDITEQQWEEIKLLKENRETELKAAREAVVRANTELDELKKKLAELKDVLAAREKLGHKLSLLNDLDNLFKGKRFVEFVAIHQLKYVSLEASKRLKEITSGNYGLEVDEEGKFIIRDYKNGGAARDASTLSGGETFLASLSLALSLSAQIQLKGTAPLELFFLDEGFGTLDDNLLDIVMNSLESIYNERLSVGIISHVESIKNRMPVKLIVTPAAAGISGSRVILER